MMSPLEMRRSRPRTSQFMTTMMFLLLQCSLVRATSRKRTQQGLGMELLFGYEFEFIEGADMF